MSMNVLFCLQVRLPPAMFQSEEDAEDPYEAERSIAMVMPAFLSDAEVEQIHQAGAAAELKDPRGGKGGEFQVSTKLFVSSSPPSLKTLFAKTGSGQKRGIMLPLLKDRFPHSSVSTGAAARGATEPWLVEAREELPAPRRSLQRRLARPLSEDGAGNAGCLDRAAPMWGAGR